MSRLRPLSCSQTWAIYFFFQERERERSNKYSAVSRIALFSIARNGFFPSCLLLHFTLFATIKFMTFLGVGGGRKKRNQ